MAKRNAGEVTPDYILWPWSQNSQGKHPIKVRITHQRRRKYYSLLTSEREKLFLSEGDYQRLATAPIQKLRGENRKIRSLMDNSIEVAKVAVELATNRGKVPFSFVQFEKHYLGENASKNFITFFKNHVERLGKKGQAGTTRAYASALSAFNHFQRGREIDPADLTCEKLRELEDWLRESHKVFDEATGKTRTVHPKNDTSVGIYMRCIRAVYNEIAATDEYLRTIYPFSQTPNDRKYKIPTGTGGQKGQTMSKDEIVEFVKGKVDSESSSDNPMYRAKQLFLFSFFAQGINFKDMALLQFENIGKDVIEFERQKTIRTSRDATKIRIPLTSELKEILIEQGIPDRKKSSFVFGVLDQQTQSEKSKDDKIRQWIKTTNKWLAKYCELNELPRVSTYSARHSFASLAKSFLPLVQISKMLGHSRVSTTQVYLGAYNDEENRAGLMKVFKDVKGHSLKTKSA